MSNGQIPVDDNYRAVLALWSDTLGQALPVHVNSIITGADGKKYAVLDTPAGGGGGGGTSSTYGNPFPNSGTAAGFTDGTNMRPAYVAPFHNSDNQVPQSSQYGLLTGGIAQILNPSGNLDRQRGTGFDGIPAVGVATGTQQLAGPALTTTFGQNVTGSASAQNVQVASSANLKIGDMVLTQDNPEYVEILAVPDGTHVNGIFKNSHTSGQTLTWFHYNQARDATVGDNAAATGLSPSATYLYNQVSGVFEFDRSANGEKDGASGAGTAVAAEYEWNAGGPLNNSNVISGLQFDRARNLQAKGAGSGTISNNPLAAGSTSLTLSSAPTTLLPGQQIILDRAGANPEANYVATSYTLGSTSVPLQNATAFSHAQNSTVEWDQFAALGPGLNGFMPTGIGIEEEALYNPVDGKMYIERSATADGMAPQNIVAESPTLWNGSTMDRLTGFGGAASTSDWMRYLANAGKLFRASTGKQSASAAGLVGMSLFNPSTQTTKRIVIFSIKLATTSAAFHQLQQTTADPALSGVTPSVTNFLTGGGASVVSVTATATVRTADGTTTDVQTITGNLELEFIPAGAVLVIPPGTAGGFEALVNTSGANNFVVSMVWAEI